MGVLGAGMAHGFVLKFNDRHKVGWTSGCFSQGLSHWQIEVLEGGDSAMAFQTGSSVQSALAVRFCFCKD